jgi:glycosyltransferase involved in cell wall biosynthesis
MVSRPGRLRALRSAVDDFRRQTHRAKELLIVVDDDDYAIKVGRAIREESEPIYLVRVSPKLNLGELRNVAMNCCHGQFACQWDDDDRYSPERLALQMDSLRTSGAHACFLFQQLHFFENSRELFWTDWRYRDGLSVTAALTRIIPGTVLCKRAGALYPEDGDRAIKGEDSVFASQLLRLGAIGLETPPGTYMRIYHGRNTWNWAHHREIAVHRSLPGKALHANRLDIAKALLHFKIASPVKVMAANRLAFRL